MYVLVRSPESESFESENAARAPVIRLLLIERARAPLGFRISRDSPSSYA